jgi:hypothetical protein
MLSNGRLGRSRMRDEFGDPNLNSERAVGREEAGSLPVANCSPHAHSHNFPVNTGKTIAAKWCAAHRVYNFDVQVRRAFRL